MPELPEELAGLPVAEFAFPGPLRDKLVAAILNGSKTSTAHLLVEDQLEGADPVAVGHREVVVDSQGQPVCVIRTVGVDVVRLGEATDEHARDEGEGYADAAAWRAGHERFWTSPQYVAEVGHQVLDDDTLVVCERFAVERVL